MIESKELMTNSDLIMWLSTLSAGYAKPNLSPAAGAGATVRETKNFMPFIMSVNSRLCELSGIDCPDVGEFLKFKTNNKNNY